MNKDLEIMQAIALGDQGAFHHVYELYASKVYNTSISYVQQKEDAEEITQDVFTRIFRSASSFKGDASLSTWIYRITVNTSLNKLKRKKKFSFSKLTKSEIERPDFEHPGVLLENKEKAKLLFKKIDSLPPTQKTAFILSYVEELPRKQVAEIMSTSLKAIESLLHRAKANLRKKLENDYLKHRNQ